MSLQFYSEEDESIFSRDKKYKIHVPGIRVPIQSFIRYLVAPIDLVRKDHYREYLERVCEKVDFDITQVWDNFMGNISDLSDEDLSVELVVNFLVGPIRSTIQQREFNRLVEQLKTSIDRDLSDSVDKSKIQLALEDAFARNDESVSMLYNLSFLRYIITEFGNGLVLTEVDKCISHYTMQLKQKLRTTIGI